MHYYCGSLFNVSLSTWCAFVIRMSIVSVCFLRSCTIIPQLVMNSGKYPRLVYFMPSRLAGHSHWQNVRHIKEAKDKERARLTCFYLAKVDAAVKCSYVIFAYLC